MILLTQFQRSWLIWNLKKKLYKPTVIFWNEKRRLIPPSIQIKPLDLSPRDHMKDWYKNDYGTQITSIIVQPADHYLCLLQKIAVVKTQSSTDVRYSGGISLYFTGTKKDNSCSVSLHEVSLFFFELHILIIMKSHNLHWLGSRWVSWPHTTWPRFWGHKSLHHCSGIS